MILEDFHQRACREGQTRYLGEIAGKLRVLVHQGRTNRALLLDLMSETGVAVSSLSIALAARGRWIFTATCRS